MEMREALRVNWIGAAGPVGLTEERFLALASSGLDRSYRLAGLILGNSADAEDATQDALESAWRARRSLHDPAAFEGWFDRILVNTCRDRLRRRRRLAFVPMADDDETPAGDEFAAVLERDQILATLAVLTPEQRTVVALHYWADLPLTEVAVRLGWPVGTVKTRLHAALERMRARLDGETAQPGKVGRE